MRRIVWVIAGVLLLSTGGFVGVQQWRVWPLRRLPSVDLSQSPDEVRTAIELALARVRSSPRSGSNWGELGLLLRAHEFGPEANACLEVAQEFDPQSAIWPYIRGVSLTSTDPPAARGCFARAAWLRPDLALPRHRLAELLLSEQKFDEAEGWFSQALQLQWDDPRGQLGLARVALHRNELKNALDRATIAAERAPQQRAIHELLVQIHHRLGNKDAAEAERRLLAALPEGETAWDDPLVLRVLQLRRDPAWRGHLAEEALGRGDLATARDISEDLASRHPDNPDWTVLLARTQILQKDYQPAADLLADAAVRFPQSAEIRFQQGTVEYLRGHWGRSEKRLREAVALKPDYGEAWFNLGQALRRQQQRAEAIAALRQAVKFRPELLAAHLDLAELLLEAGERAEAFKVLQDAEKLSPEDARLRTLLQRAK